MRIARLLLFLTLLCFGNTGSFGQNLVPNPNFETHTGCPNGFQTMPFSANYSVFQTVTEWTNPVKYSSPDYLHTCAIPSSNLQIPNSIFGYQQPHSGNAYIGIVAFDGQFQNGNLILDYREYIQIKLSSPLVAGQHYCLSFYVSPTISSSFNLNSIAIEEIGMNISAQRPIDSFGYTMNVPYHLRNTPGNYLTDTAQWHQITGGYTATGGEEWLTIGCFKTTNTYPAFVPGYPSVPNPNLSYRSYIYIDDVSLKQITAADTFKYVQDTLVCQAQNLGIDLQGLPDASYYYWNTGSHNMHFTAQDTGVYWCSSVVGCSLIIDSFYIRYQAPKPLNLGNDTFNCFSQPMTISSNNVYDSYGWSTGSANSSIIVSQSGDYVLMATDYCGTQKDTIHIDIQAPTPLPITHDTTICQMSWQPELQVEGSNLLWYYNASDNSGGPSQPYINTLQYGTQTVYVTQTIGHCKSGKAPVNVQVKYKPDANIGDYISICEQSDSLIGKEYPEVNYLWNTNEMICCIKPRQSGYYTLTISNSCGISTDSIFVDRTACDECLFLPNAFTPNGDGKNDVFAPILKCPVYPFRMEIFNRWGGKIFSTNNVGQGWNGMVNNLRVDAGAYVYLIQYRSTTTGSFKTLKGNVSLVR